MTATLRFTRIDDLTCLVHDERNPAADDWKAYVQAFAEVLRVHGVRKLLVVSRGGGPNAAQRKHLVSDIVPAMGGDAKALKTAVCTSSPVARGITVALGWLSSTNLTGFGYDDVHRALDYLEVPVARHPPVLREVANQITALARSRAIL
jgi:hypothetical protein